MQPMNDPRNSSEASSIMSRRRVVAAVGTATITATSIGTYLSGRSEAASIQVDSLDVSSQSFEAESVSPVVDVDMQYSYDVGDKQVASVRVELLVGGQVVAYQNLQTQRSSLDADASLSAKLSKSDAWNSSDFTVDVGKSVEHSINVGVRLAVRDSTESVIVDAKASDTATLSITHPQKNEWTASVSATGTIRDASN